MLDDPNAVVLEGGRVEKAELPGQWGGGERSRTLKTGSLCWERLPSPEAPAPHGLDSGRKSLFLREEMGKHVLLTLFFVTYRPTAKVLLMEFVRFPLQEVE